MPGMNMGVGMYDIPRTAVFSARRSSRKRHAMPSMAIPTTPIMTPAAMQAAAAPSGRETFTRIGHTTPMMTMTDIVMAVPSPIPTSLRAQRSKRRRRGHVRTLEWRARVLNCQAEADAPEAPQDRHADYGPRLRAAGAQDRAARPRRGAAGVCACIAWTGSAAAQLRASVGGSGRQVGGAA